MLRVEYMLRAGATVKGGFVPVLLRVDMVPVSTGILMRGGRSRTDSMQVPHIEDIKQQNISS